MDEPSKPVSLSRLTVPVVVIPVLMGGVISLPVSNLFDRLAMAERDIITHVHKDAAVSDRDLRRELDRLWDTLAEVKTDSRERHDDQQRVIDSQRDTTIRAIEALNRDVDKIRDQHRTLGVD